MTPKNENFNKKTYFESANVTLMVDIIILNPIGSYKVNFNGTNFVLRPIFYLKTPLMFPTLTHMHDGSHVVLCLGSKLCNKTCQSLDPFGPGESASVGS